MSAILATITALKSYPGSETEAIVTDPLQGGVFSFHSASITTDEGITFSRDAAVGTGYWLRVFDAKDGISAGWFGLISTNSSSNINPGTTVCTANYNALKKALDVASATPLAITKVVIPAGKFWYSATLYVPTGVLLTGAGAIAAATDRGTSKLVFAPPTGTGTTIIDAIRLIEKSPKDTVLAWYGAITNLSFFGSNSNAGWAISCRRNSGDAPLAVIDMNYFENLEMRNFNKGGIEFPMAGVPLYAKNIRGAYMNGPVIKISNPGRSSQSINLHNISGDHNTIGAIWLDQLDTSNNVLITNLKAEAGINSTFPGQPYCQVNPIICTDCTATIAVDNASSINTADDYGHLQTSATISSAVGSDTFTSPSAHNLKNGDRVKIFSTDAFIPGFDQSAIYFVLEDASDASKFQLAGNSGGDALKVITPPTGTPALPATIGVSVYTGFTTIVGIPAGIPIIPSDPNLGKISLNTLSGTKTHTVSLTDHGFENHQQVKFRASVVLPPELSLNTIYYVLNKTKDTFEIEEYLGWAALPINNGMGLNITNNITSANWVKAYKASNAAFATPFQTASFNYFDNTFTLANHGLANNQILEFPGSTVYAEDTFYYVVNVDAQHPNEFQVSLSVRGSVASPVDPNHPNTGTASVNISKINDVFRANRIAPGALISVERKLVLPAFTAGSPLKTSVTIPAEPANVTPITLSASDPASHIVGDTVKFYPAGPTDVLPFNMVAGRIYYIKTVEPGATDNTYNITITDIVGGDAINCPDTGIGTPTVYLQSATTSKKPKISWSSASTRLGLVADNKGTYGNDWVSLDSGEPKIIAQTNIGWKSVQGVFNNLISDNFITLSANPTAADLPDGSSHVYKVGSEVRLWVNDGGTMRSIIFS